MPKNKTVTESALHSHKYTLYKEIYPRPRVVLAPFFEEARFSRELCRELFPDQFELSVIDDFFGAWRNQNKVEPADVKAHLQQRVPGYAKSYYVLQDKLEYLTQLTLSERSRGAQTIYYTSVKFSNDGFFYKPSAEYDTKRIDVRRHDSSTWAQLKADVYKGAFGSIMEWGAEYMAEPCEVQIFYDSEVERIDICFKLQDEPATESMRLDVTFEPGYPVGDIEFKDEWDKL